MKRNSLIAILALFIGMAFFACDNDNSNDVSKKQVIENYAAIAYANYKQAYDDAVLLQTAIKTFTITPTDANFNNAKTAWKSARESYGTTEAFRFAGGPIDDENGPEAYLNAWPLDENFIDYVDGAPTAGIINNLATYPTIDKDLLVSLNEKDGEKNISIGYHAIEFLLWGQDLTPPSANLPGQRPYTDYVTGTGATASNQGRRAAYLNACADLLVEHLEYVVQQWKAGGEYRTKFLVLDENIALKNMYLGIVTLITTELPVERMKVAVSNANQEDEHSCFSDNTHRDIVLNLQGVINIYQGKYGTIDGPSLEDLVKQASTTTYNETQTSLTACTTKVATIPVPFDLAIVNDPIKVTDTATQFINFGANLLAGAVKIGIMVNI